MPPTAFSDARRIRRGERDYELDLEVDRWPRGIGCPEGWEARRGGTLRRKIAGVDSGMLACDLDEAMLRFPAAPIHGLQRLHESHSSAGPALNVHSYRILTGAKFKRPVKRLFLLHNGLNELTRMGLYYELAAHLISEEPEGTACVLRPFPGHLTRFPYHAFGEQPLDGYLWDGSHLFRQFVRHMVETQWFLSACVRRSEYRSLAGANLLAENSDPAKSRLDDTCLAKAMSSAWGTLYDSSDFTLRDPLKKQSEAPGMKPPLKGLEPFRQPIRTLRNYLGLHERLGGDLSEGVSEPKIHVLGYSLGGFAAQSVFMSWPFAVDSCSTLLSGGPLRDLSPTAFADPEEWQTVLHSLRYELDEAMTTARFNKTESHIAGMEQDLFIYFQRTFYEVFQQEYHGSFQSRLSEFRPRMLFVVGGDDPIVRPQSVLDSGPPGGINLFEIAGLGHFLASEPRTPEERAQREFWLPEIGKLITRFADNASKIEARSREDTWLNDAGRIRGLERKPGNPVTLTRLTESERGLTEGALPGELFGRHLDDLLARARTEPHSYLVILRNEAPTILLDPDSVQRHARALHHDDVKITEYCRGVVRRWQFIEDDPRRICVVLPWNAKRVLEHLDAPHGFPSQSETAVGQVPHSSSPALEWAACKRSCDTLARKCVDSVRVFDGRTSLRASDEEVITPLVQAGLRSINRKHEAVTGDATLLVPALPDCWIWFSPDCLVSDRYGGVPETAAAAREGVIKLAVEAQQPNDKKLAQAIERDHIRIITVSRARFNPRFCGRLVVELELVKRILLHSALCLNAAAPWLGYQWERDESPDGASPTET